MKHVRTYSIYGNKKDSVECPDDAGETAYYFKIDHNSLTLYRTKGDTEQAQEAAAEAEREAMREASMARESKLTEMTKRHFELRKEFVSEAHPREYAYVMRYASSVLIGDGTWRRGPDMALLTELLGVDEPDDNEDFATLKKRLLPRSPSPFVRRLRQNGQRPQRLLGSPLGQRQRGRTARTRRQSRT